MGGGYAFQVDQELSLREDQTGEEHRFEVAALRAGRIALFSHGSDLNLGLII